MEDWEEAQPPNNFLELKYHCLGKGCMFDGVAGFGGAVNRSRPPQYLGEGAFIQGNGSFWRA